MISGALTLQLIYGDDVLGRFRDWFRGYWVLVLYEPRNAPPGHFLSTLSSSLLRVSSLSVSNMQAIGLHSIGSWVYDHVALSREKQKKAGLTVKRAPALLPSHTQALVVPMQAHLNCTEESCQRVLLAQDIAVFTVASRTTNDRKDPAVRFPAYIQSTERVWSFV